MRVERPRISQANCSSVSRTYPLCWNHPLQHLTRCYQTRIRNHTRRARKGLPRRQYHRIHSIFARVCCLVERSDLVLIRSLSSGFDTEVGGKGSQLSGGQKRESLLSTPLIQQLTLVEIQNGLPSLEHSFVIQRFFSWTRLVFTIGGYEALF